VTLSIFDANLNDVRVVGYHIAFGNGEAAIAGFHLDAVIAMRRRMVKPKAFDSQSAAAPGRGK